MRMVALLQCMYINSDGSCTAQMDGARVSACGSSSMSSSAPALQLLRRPSPHARHMATTRELVLQGGTSSSAGQPGGFLRRPAGGRRAARVDAISHRAWLLRNLPSGWTGANSGT